MGHWNERSRSPCMPDSSARDELAVRGCAGGELAAPLAQLREAQQGRAHVVVRRELQAVDARQGEGGAQRRFAALRQASEALPEFLVVRVQKDLLARFCILQQDKS